MNPKKANRSIKRIIFVTGIIGALVVANVLFTMITHQHFHSGIDVLAFRGEDYYRTNTLSASRGFIRDRNNEIIAQDVDTYNIFAILDENRLGIKDAPAYVVNVEDTAAALAPKLNVDASVIEEALNNGKENKAYQVEFGNSGKNLSKEVKEQIDALGLPGIEFTQTTNRIYPTGKFASHLIGYALPDQETGAIVGKMGMEAFFNDELTGTDGSESYDISAEGAVIPGTKHLDQQAVNGNDVYLTLDRNVQLALETCLQGTMDEFGARRAWGMIMEVETGKILAWSSYPTFDLNERDIEDYLNVPSAYAYEPGSVMKGFTYASAIDNGVYAGDNTFYTEKFYMGYDAANDKLFRASTPGGAISDVPIRDALEKNMGTISFDIGFMKSSNIAICELLANYLSPSVFETYLDKFGFFKQVGTYGLDSEASGTKNYQWPSDKFSTGFGQASSVTALQLMQGYTAIFNDGKMMKPYFVDRIVNPYSGEATYSSQPQVVGQPISEETSKQMIDLMHDVVTNDAGTAHGRYRMDDIDLIAKTGTGEIFSDNEGYYTNSIMAAAPYDDPKIMMYYAFESRDVLMFHGNFFKQAFKEAMVASHYSAGGENTTEYGNYKEYEMPGLTNHTLSYMDEKLYDMAVNKVIIGDGSSVIKQYPEAGETIISGQNIFLVTDGTTISMPNMIGWSKKDLSRFWEMTGIGITVDGFGVVTEQSVSAGDTIDKYSEVKVTLK